MLSAALVMLCLSAEPVRLSPGTQEVIKVGVVTSTPGWDSSPGRMG
jgi:hypothetical protein